MHTPHRDPAPPAGHNPADLPVEPDDVTLPRLDLPEEDESGEPVPEAPR
jgi:hypothetical protein